MGQDMLTIIDAALERFAARDIVASNEIVDVLLDLRSAILSDAALERLLAAEPAPSPS